MPSWNDKDIRKALGAHFDGGLFNPNWWSIRSMSVASRAHHSNGGKALKREGYIKMEHFFCRVWTINDDEGDKEWVPCGFRMTVASPSGCGEHHYCSGYNQPIKDAAKGLPADVADLDLETNVAEKWRHLLQHPAPEAPEPEQQMDWRCYAAQQRLKAWNRKDRKEALRLNRHTDSKEAAKEPKGKRGTASRKGVKDAAPAPLRLVADNETWVDQAWGTIPVNSGAIRLFIPLEIYQGNLRGDVKKRLIMEAPQNAWKYGG
ncbi:hypothetical protein EJ04DRAFT_607447 [Polyplosphaeria fusca]|uniref:Uncharacterized protein n=1 Tax=Polyplosphaeria fusca TaxID=682080 RepID=A0A9P4V138_9PLEO|nr:hypothetical protein EJ04DRAFT_607447 [Polyplosphaeria fusca]